MAPSDVTGKNLAIPNPSVNRPGVVFWTPFYLCFNFCFNFCFKYASYNTAKTVLNRYSENCFNGVVSHENHAHHKNDIQ